MASDNFNRADGAVGSDWTAGSDGGLHIVSQQIAGFAGVIRNIVRTAETYGSDHYSEIQAAATLDNWIAPAVRFQNNCQTGYSVIYFNNSGTYILQVYKRLNGNYTALGSSYTCGLLAAGTPIRLTVIGSQLTVTLNGAVVIQLTDSSTPSGGAPGIDSYGDSTADNWSGDNAQSGVALTASAQSATGASASTSAPALLSASAHSTTAATATLYAPGAVMLSASAQAASSASATVTTVAPAWVGGTSGSSGGVSQASYGVAYTPHAVGNLIAVAVAVYDSVGASDVSLTDTQGIGWQLATSLYSYMAVGNYAMAIFYGVAKATSATTITVNAPNYANGGYYRVGIDEYSIVNALDGVAAANGTGATLNSGTLATNHASEVLYGWMISDSGISAPGTNFTLRETSLVEITEDRIVGTTGSYSATAANSGTGNWSAMMAAFYAGGVPVALSPSAQTATSATAALSAATSLGPSTASAVSQATATVGVGNVPMLAANAQCASAASSTLSAPALLGATANVQTQANAVVTTVGSVSASDNFNRADGAIGANWTAGSQGALHIASQQVAGDAGAVRAVIRTAETYGGDHYSQIEATGAALGGTGNWIAPAVRVQNSGQTFYAALYSDDAGPYQLALWKCVNGSYTELSAAAVGPPGYTLSGVLSAGSQIRLSVAGSQITVTLNGARIIKVIDTSITGGAPGIISDGVASADNWAGGNALAEPTAPYQLFTSSPPNSANNGGDVGGYTVKVLTPDNPAPGVPHNFLYALPVDSDGVTTYGDGIDVLYGLGIHNRYNLTIIQPAFGIGSWYVNHPTDPTLQHETYMVSDLVPWVTANYTTSGSEQHWLIGFSRSGWGGAGLMFRHPTVFRRGAFWDWPFGLSDVGQYGSGEALGTNANLAANYQMTSAYLDAYKGPFQITPRIWISGYEAFQTDDADADTQFTAKGILHMLSPQIQRAHAWDSGWPADALANLAILAAVLGNVSAQSATSATAMVSTPVPLSAAAGARTQASATVSTSSVPMLTASAQASMSATAAVSTPPLLACAASAIASATAAVTAVARLAPAAGAQTQASATVTSVIVGIYLTPFAQARSSAAAVLVVPVGLSANALVLTQALVALAPFVSAAGVIIVDLTPVVAFALNLTPSPPIPVWLS
jgi:hypothetical protein